MLKGAKVELLRSNTPKVTKLEGKNGRAAPELLRSSSLVAPEQGGAAQEQKCQYMSMSRNIKKNTKPQSMDSKIMTQMMFNWVSVYRVNFFRIAQQNAT